MRAGKKGQGGHLWKLYYLQILGFPLMGNFTTISWGLVQIKTNGDPDSWLKSGYCKTQRHTHSTVRRTAAGVKGAQQWGAAQKEALPDNPLFRSPAIYRLHQL